MGMDSLRPASKRGFSLVELTIVVVVLGVLATFAVPRFMRSVECSKAAEAYNYCENVAAGEAAYFARHGEFTGTLSDLNVSLNVPQYFTLALPTSADWNTNWEIRLTRSGASAGYGAYTVTFDQNGFNRAKSTIPSELQRID